MNISNRNIGLGFKRFDLHVHTTGSEDFIDRGVTPQQIVQASIDAGLDAIAVTDHNSGKMVDDIKKAAEGTGLVIFPGVEITVAQVHMIALFDIDKTSTNIADLLTSLEILSADQGKIETFSPKTVNDAANIIRKHGGLPILAHVNSDKGVLGAIKGISKYPIIKNPSIAAVEVTDIGADGTSPTAKTLNGNTPEYGNRVLAAYQASDNPVEGSGHGHGIWGIGKRSTLFRVDEINLRSLRQCFLDPEIRIIKSESIASSHIDKIKIKGGYFDGQEVDFHEGLNTLIGGKGGW